MAHRAEPREYRRSLAAALIIVVPIVLAACAEERPAYVLEPDRAVSPEIREGRTYTVVVHRGDSLGEIAERSNVSVATIERMNDLSDRRPIYPGQVLRVPSPPRSDRAEDRHEERRDDYADSVRPVPRPHHATPVYYEPRSADRNASTRSDDQQSWWSSWWTKPNDDAPVDTSSAHFMWPVQGRVIEAFGRGDNGERNDGINIATAEGAPIRAAASGTVTYAGNELRGYGNLVLIKHSNGFVTAYAHAQSFRVARGDIVERGQVIGTAGATGDVGRPQLHFEIRRGVQPVDPSRFLVADRAS